MPTWPTVTLRRLLGVLIFYVLCGCFLLSLVQAYRWLEAVTDWPSIFISYSLLPLAWLGSQQLWALRRDYGIAVGHHPPSPSVTDSALRDSMSSCQPPHTVPSSPQSWSPSLDGQGTVICCPHCSRMSMIVTPLSIPPSWQHPRPHGWPRA
jgi:hypothetical protein